MDQVRAEVRRSRTVGESRGSVVVALRNVASASDTLTCRAGELGLKHDGRNEKKEDGERAIRNHVAQACGIVGDLKSEQERYCPMVKDVGS